MKNALYLFLAHPHGLIVTGTALSILVLVGLALFSRRDVDTTEDILRRQAEVVRQGNAMTVLVYEQTGWRPMITARSSRTSLVGGKRPEGGV
jgi:hypothetical protein